MEGDEDALTVSESESEGGSDDFSFIRPNRAAFTAGMPEYSGRVSGVNQASYNVPNPHFNSSVESAGYYDFVGKAQGSQAKLREKFGSFVMRNKDFVFQPLSQDEVPRLESRADEMLNAGSYATPPTYDLFLGMDKAERSRQFFSTVKVGDIILGKMYSPNNSGINVKLLCFDGPKRAFLEDLDLIENCVEENMIPKILISPNEPYQLEDKVRCEILNICYTTRSVTLGMRGVAAPPEVLRSYPLGWVLDEELPPQYLLSRKRAKLKERASYEEYLHSIPAFKNPNLTVLASNLGIYKNSSFMQGLRMGFPQRSMISAIREQKTKIDELKKQKIAQSNLTKGKECLRSGNTDEALTAFTKALVLDPTNFEGLLSRGIIYAERGMLEQAKTDLQTAATLSPGSTERSKEVGGAIFVVGTRFQDGKNLEYALSCFTTCVDVLADATGAVPLLLKLHEQLALLAVSPGLLCNKIKDLQERLKMLLEEELLKEEARQPKGILKSSAVGSPLEEGELMSSSPATQLSLVSEISSVHSPASVEEKHSVDLPQVVIPPGNSKSTPRKVTTVTEQRDVKRETNGKRDNGDCSIETPAERTPRKGTDFVHESTRQISGSGPDIRVTLTRTPRKEDSITQPHDSTHKRASSMSGSRVESPRCERTTSTHRHDSSHRRSASRVSSRLESPRGEGTPRKRTVSTHRHDSSRRRSASRVSSRLESPRRSTEQRTTSSRRHHSRHKSPSSRSSYSGASSKDRRRSKSNHRRHSHGKRKHKKRGSSRRRSSSSSSRSSSVRRRKRRSRRDSSVEAVEEKVEAYLKSVEKLALSSATADAVVVTISQDRRSTTTDSDRKVELSSAKLNDKTGRRVSDVSSSSKSTAVEGGITFGIKSKKPKLPKDMVPVVFSSSESSSSSEDSFSVPLKPKPKWKPIPAAEDAQDSSGTPPSSRNPSFWESPRFAPANPSSCAATPDRRNPSNPHTLKHAGTPSQSSPHHAVGTPGHTRWSSVSEEPRTPCREARTPQKTVMSLPQEPKTPYRPNILSPDGYSDSPSGSGSQKNTESHHIFGEVTTNKSSSSEEDYESAKIKQSFKPSSRPETKYVPSCASHYVRGGNHHSSNHHRGGSRWQNSRFPVGGFHNRSTINREDSSAFQPQPVSRGRGRNRFPRGGSSSRSRDPSSQRSENRSRSRSRSSSRSRRRSSVDSSRRTRTDRSRSSSRSHTRTIDSRRNESRSSSISRRRTSVDSRRDRTDESRRTSVDSRHRTDDSRQSSPARSHNSRNSSRQRRSSTRSPPPPPPRISYVPTWKYDPNYVSPNYRGKNPIPAKRFNAAVAKRVKTEFKKHK